MRRVRPMLVLLALVVPLLASPSLGQGGIAGIVATISPAEADAAPGDYVPAVVRVTNNKLHDVIVDIHMASDARLFARASQTTVDVPAGMSRSIAIEMYVANDATPGHLNRTVTIRERPSGVTPADETAATLTVRVHAKPDAGIDDPNPRPELAQRNYGMLGATPNGTIRFPVEIRNPSVRPENLSVITLAPDGWNVAEASYRAITFAPGETRIVDFVARPGPAAASGPGRVVALNNANSSLRSTADVYFVVESAPSTPSFAFTAPNPRASAAPAETVEFHAEVQSVRNLTLDFAATLVPEGWRVTLSEASLHVAANSTARLVISVRPGDAPGAGSVMVRATARETGEVRDVILTLDVNARRFVQLRVDPERLAGAPGDELVYDVELNTSHETIVHVAVQNRSPWLDARLKVDTFHLAANGTARTSLTVRILDNATEDGFFTLHATTSDASVEAWATGRVTHRATSAPGEPEPQPDPPVEGPEREPQPEPEPEPQPEPEPEPVGPTIAPPEPEPRLLLAEVEPAEIVVQPGESARGVLRVSSNASIAMPLQISVSLPSGLTASFDEPPAHIAAGARLHLGFTVAASASATEGEHAGHARVTGADGGAFVVRVGPPALPPPDDADSAAITGAAPPATRDAVILAGVAAGVGSAAIGIAWARRRWPLAFAALYTKLRPNKVLDHDARKRIADIVRAEPGVTMSDLQRRLALANGEIAHHLHVLERSRVVLSARDGQLRRVYPVEVGRAPHAPDLGERALELLREQPRTLSALARDLGVTRQALHYHVKKLHATGRIDALPDGTLRAAAERDAPTAR